MRASRTPRTALVAAGVTAALGVSAAGAVALPSSPAGDVASAGHTTAHSTAQRVHVKTVKLADKVSTAKVYKTGKYRYEAEIWAKGVKYGTLYTNGKAAPPAHAQNNGLHVTLHPDGKVTSRVERAKPQPVVKRVLVADGRAAYGQNNGLHVTLQPDGQLASWVAP
ncbi:hypothetical protein [Streptomyces sp. GESEQ-35]|uniref:hypothetical protein n=1 Tax=Streptomyces sp. GESEQ-35 TaxID=2812657 RepID=UPI001B31B520|nr:hypothetical protein [Streptomyces sp. GESEQ-35]